MVTSHITARDVMERLDEAVGANKWSDNVRIETDGKGFYWATCRLKVELPVDDSSVIIEHEDVGEGDTPKGASSDAFKRAAVKFGIGRFLYDWDTAWVDLDERGKFKDPPEDILHKVYRPYQSSFPNKKKRNEKK